MRCESLQEPEFDRQWLAMLISHHQEAITMSDTEQADGSSSVAISLAGQIISAQQAESEEMNELLAVP